MINASAKGDLLMNTLAKKPALLVGGIILGIGAAILAVSGNPGNMAFCIACFVRDIAGAVKLHNAPPVEYFRPEIVGLVCGSMIISLGTKEFKVTAGQSPLLKFFLGAITMIMALVFLGCPLRMLIRMAAGDLNAYVGFVGYVCGCGIGTFFLKQNYDTGEAREIPSLSGYILPLVLIAGLILYVLDPFKVEDGKVVNALFNHSIAGPGSMHAAVHISLIVGIIFGAIAQKTRACFAGGIRNAFFMKDFDLLMPILGIFITLLVFNVVRGTFNPSFIKQPIAHVDHVFNFVPMMGVGLCAVLAGGCPMRQLILAGSGSADSACNVLGMLVGAAFAHNFGLASAASAFEGNVVTGGGPTAAGKVATIVCLVIALIIGFANKEVKN